MQITLECTFYGSNTPDVSIQSCIYKLSRGISKVIQQISERFQHQSLLQEMDTRSSSATELRSGCKLGQFADL